jgi:hypothetical protein
MTDPKQSAFPADNSKTDVGDMTIRDWFAMQVLTRRRPNFAKTRRLGYKQADAIRTGDPLTVDDCLRKELAGVICAAQHTGDVD